MHFFGYLHTTNIFRLRETPRHDYLSLKVFAAVYSVRNNLWATNKEFPKGDIAIRRFQQFRKLLEIVAEKNENGDLLEPFDLFDFSQYDKFIRLHAPKATFHKEMTHEKSSKNLQEKSDKKHEPRKRIQRTKYIPARKRSE